MSTEAAPELLLHNTAYTHISSPSCCCSGTSARVARRKSILRNRAPLPPTPHDGGLWHIAAAASMSRQQTRQRQPPLTRRSAEAALQEVLPDGQTIRSIEAVRSGRLLRVYRARTVPSSKEAGASACSDADEEASGKQPRRSTSLDCKSKSTSLCLVLPPASSVRMLRAERDPLRAEAAVLAWLQQQQDVQAQGEPETVTSGMVVLNRLCAHRSPSTTTTWRPPGLLLRQSPPASRPPSSSSAKEEGVDGAEGGQKISPPLPTPPPLYNIVSMPPGRPLSMLPGTRSPAERASVAYQVGNLCRHLASFTSPSGRFGPALGVLSPPSSGPSFTSGGSAGWATAYQALLEGALRDGEDMAVTLPYSAIRTHFARLAPLLDGVAEARLVIVDAGAESNVLVVRDGESEGEEEDSDDDGEPDGGWEHVNAEPDEATAATGTDDGTAAGKGSGRSITVTGLLDWSSAVFGDPLFGVAFSGGGSDDDDAISRPDPSFLRGFGGGTDTEATTSLAQPGTPDHFCGSSLPLIDDPASAHARILLYACYHNVSAVVREFYRPSSRGTMGTVTGTSSGPERELRARRRLSETLRQLDELLSRRADTDAAAGMQQQQQQQQQSWCQGASIVEHRPSAVIPSRHRRLSTDTIPAKRARLLGEGE